MAADSTDFDTPTTALTQRTSYLKAKVDQVGLVVPSASFIEVASTPVGLDFISASTGGYVNLTDISSNPVSWPFPGAKTGDVFRGSVYLQLAVPASCVLALSVRVYEDGTLKKDKVILVVGGVSTPVNQYVTVPVFWTVVGASVLLSVQVYVSISGATGTITNIGTDTSHEWGDFQILRPIV